MIQDSAMQPIGGLSAPRLLAIAQHLKLDCKGPVPQDHIGPYVEWSCRGLVTVNGPPSTMTLGFAGIDADRILSVTGQIHATPKTSNYAGACRKVVGYILAALDPSISDQAHDWLDRVLADTSTGKLELDGLVFEIILQTDRSLSFDVHTAGF